MEALFRTVSETPEPMKARLKGNLPPWLKGSLLRVGPGQFEVGSQAYNHLFDGLALIHRFNIQDGEVTYQNRFERSDCFLRAQQENRIVVSEFGTRAYPDPCKSIFSRLFSYFKSTSEATDNNLVNLMPVGNEVYAMTETPFIRRIDPQTLESGKEKVDYSKYVAVNQITAHPHIEPDGTIYNFGTRYGKNGVYALVKIPPTDDENNPVKQASILGTIPTKWSFWPSYHHSFGITDNYVIFVEQPMVINVLKLMMSRVLLSPKGHGGAFEFYKKTPVQFHVIEKATGKELTTTYLADAFFTFHHINTYEEEGHIIVDACCYEKGEIIHDLFLEHLKKDGFEPAIAKRYVLPLPDSKAVKCGENLVSLSYGTATAVRREDGNIYCTPEILSREPVELCQINCSQYNKKKYRYFYGLSWVNLAKLIKVDTRTKENKHWSDEGCFPSEPVFVPAPDAIKEDDGVVLSLVVKSSGPARSVFLLVLDGETFTELARAEVPSPAEAAMTFHGIFLPDVDYSKYVAVNQITAHPHIEPDGTIYNFGTRYGKDGVYALVKIPPTDEENNPIKQASILGTIPTKWSFWPSYHHSFGITENYVIFIEQPMVINVFKLMLPRFLTPKGYGGAFEFYKKTPVQFHVIDKATGKVLTTTYLADPFFTFHHINTYEEAGHLVVDACCYEKGEIIHDLFLEHLKKDGQEPAIAKRYVLPLPDSKAVKCGENLVSLSYGTATAVRQEDGAIYCTPEVLSREPVELCQINYNQYNKKKYRYFYGMSWGKLDKLVKVDTRIKENKMWSDEGCFPSEPVFVPAPDADREDAGVVLSLVVKSSGPSRSVFLLVLDGETFTELARAEVPSPAEAAMTFHGIFLPDA